MKNWKDISVSPSCSIEEALSTLNTAGLQIVLVTDSDGVLLGTVTDGDIRRAILDKISLLAPVHKVMNHNPISLPEDSSRSDIVHTLEMNKINNIPLVDSNGKVVGVESFHRRERRKNNITNKVVIMAGGLGTRLHPITETIPKPMVEINGRPILETAIMNLSDEGFSNFVLSVNYKKEMIEEYFGDGSDYGINIEYLVETDRMGTAGSLSLFEKRPELPFIVMNGDILTGLRFRSLLRFHRDNRAVATMCLKEYSYQIPFGVADIKNYTITSITEKPKEKLFVSAGIYVLDPECIDLIPKGEFFDMPTLFNILIEQKQKVCAFPLSEEWLDVGTPKDLEKARTGDEK